jgi:hypothetical protein
MSPLPLAAPRDLRIDFFRGLALLIVVVDHIEGWCGRSVVENWTLISLGFSDAAEIFVFLSGYVLAVAYSRALDQGGLAACLKKASKRSLQIYVAYQLAAWTVIGLGAWGSGWNPPSYNEQFRIGERLGESLLAALTLRFHPWGFDILAFYVPILPCMAALLALRRKAAWLAWAISGGLYLAVQFNPEWNLTRFGDGQLWYFNPLAWQFLFFVGISLGDPARKPLALVPPRWLLALAATAVVLYGLFVMKLSLPLMQRLPSLKDTFMPHYQFYWDWGGKTTLQPLRLLHFFALAYLTSLVFPRQWKFWSTRMARPIEVAGRHSLEVYAFGLVLSFVAVFLLAQGPLTATSILVMDLAACVASIGFAYGIDAWKHRHRRSTAPPSRRPAPAPHVPQPAPRRKRSKAPRG